LFILANVGFVPTAMVCEIISPTRSPRMRIDLLLQSARVQMKTTEIGKGNKKRKKERKKEKYEGFPIPGTGGDFVASGNNPL
jgi:hypothetical protein